MENIINSVVGGRYYVLAKLGVGGYSDVYKAKDVYSGEVYALKKYITSDPANKDNLLEGMERELNALKYCTHPVLPKIFNIIKENNCFYLIMEYVPGTNLKDYIKNNGPMKTSLVKGIMMQVCSGLYYLHSLEPPVIYRDLKPSNIILRDDGKIKMIDFGISKRYNRDVADELAIGSKGFAAPEQYGDKKGYSIFNTDLRTDIYGIGTTMYYLLSGKVYKNQINSHRIHGRFKRIIKKCTQINPNKRYQDCIQVLCDIKSLHILIK
jgi:serine/threonine-protein kinase